MKIFKTALAAIATILCLTSCMGNDEPKQTVQYVYDTVNNLTYVTDTETSESVVLAGATYTLDFDVIAGTVDITIAELQTSPAGSRINFKIEKAQFKIAGDGGLTVDIAGPVQYGNNTITGFKMNQYSRTVGKFAGNYFTINYTLNDNKKVRVVPTILPFTGKTEITNVATTEVKTDENPYYVYVLDFDKKQTTFSVFNLVVNGRIYQQVDLSGIGYTIDADGITFVKEGEVKAKLFASAIEPDFTVTDFNAQMSYVPDMKFDFMFDGKYKISADMKSRYERHATQQ